MFVLSHLEKQLEKTPRMGSNHTFPSQRPSVQCSRESIQYPASVKKETSWEKKTEGKRKGGILTVQLFLKPILQILATFSATISKTALMTPILKTWRSDEIYFKQLNFLLCHLGFSYFMYTKSIANFPSTLQLSKYSCIFLYCCCMQKETLWGVPDSVLTFICDQDQGRP